MSKAFISLAKTKEDWFILIEGYYLMKGLIPSGDVQKFKKLCKFLYVTTCKIRILLDTNLDVSMKGKTDFTIDEIEVYINGFLNNS